MDDSTVPEPEGHVDSGPGVSTAGFVIIWCAGEPEKVGAWLPVKRGRWLFGRGAARDTDELPRLCLVRQRPGANLPVAPLELAALSRDQLVCSANDSSGVEIERAGRCPIRVNGVDVRQAKVVPGDQLEIGAQLVLLCGERPVRLAGATTHPHSFGDADGHGIVGESVAMWSLRGAIEFIGPRAGHVLVRGESGTGKELVAAALHALSGRTGPLVSRNAATFPETLIDAELFGNAEGYPNPGMRERKGLIGAADRGTLFLDEFAELPAVQQARLLRVLDSGEYHRLGDAGARRADLRVVGATNQPNEALRKDILSRFDLTIRLPSLRERPEDVPFLLEHLVKAIVADDPALRTRALDAHGEARFARTMVQELVRNPPDGNVRGLRSALFQVLRGAEEGPLDLPSDYRADAPESIAPRSMEPEADRLVQVLNESGGSLEKAWRALALPSRFALMRLMKKHGISVRRSAGD